MCRADTCKAGCWARAVKHLMKTDLLGLMRITWSVFSPFLKCFRPRGDRKKT